jgi:type I restriction enzyme S subunit
VTPERFVENFGVIAEAPGGLLRLRELVLSRAIRGALTHAELGDGSAVAEVNELRTRLAERVADKTFRKNKTPGRTYDELRWAIPARWCWSRLDELGAIAPRNRIADTCLASFVPMPVVPEGFTGTISGAEDRPWKSIKKKYTHLADGDVALAKITPCFQNRKSVVVSGLTGGSGAGTTELHVFRPAIPAGIEPRFVLIWLKSPEFTERGVALMTGTAGQQRVPRDYFAASPFPFPPLAEQRRIVTKVDEIMAMVDGLEQRREQKRTVAIHVSKASLDELVRAEEPEQVARAWGRVAKNFDVVAGGRRELAMVRRAVLKLGLRGRLGTQQPGETPGEELLAAVATERRARGQRGDRLEVEALWEGAPEGWTWARVGDLCDVGTGSTPLKSKLAYYEGGDVPWVTSAETSQPFVTQARVHVTQLARRECRLKLYPPGTLLVAMYGQGKTRGQVSELAMAATVNQACAALSFSESAVVARAFVKLYFEARYDELRELAAGGAQPNLNLQKIRNAVLPVPPAAEQERIVRKVARLMELVCDLEASRAAAERVATQMATSTSHGWMSGRP